MLYRARALAASISTANTRALYYTIYNLQLYNSFMKQAPAGQAQTPASCCTPSLAFALENVGPNLHWKTALGREAAENR